MSQLRGVDSREEEKVGRWIENWSFKSIAHVIDSMSNAIDVYWDVEGKESRQKYLEYCRLMMQPLKNKAFKYWERYLHSVKNTFPRKPLHPIYCIPIPYFVVYKWLGHIHSPYIIPCCCCLPISISGFGQRFGLNALPRIAVHLAAATVASSKPRKPPPHASLPPSLSRLAYPQSQITSLSAVIRDLEQKRSSPKLSALLPRVRQRAFSFRHDFQCSYVPSLRHFLSPLEGSTIMSCLGRAECLLSSRH